MKCPVGNQAFAVKGSIIKEWRDNIVFRKYYNFCSHNAFPAISYGGNIFETKPSILNYKLFANHEVGTNNSGKYLPR